MATDKTRRLFPPCDKKGKVTPVEGIIPEIPPILTKTCTNIIPPTPIAIMELKGFLARIPTRIIRKMRKKTSAKIKLAPTNPNSSMTIENTKSVWASGR